MLATLHNCLVQRRWPLEAGVHQGGEAILFLADFQPLPGATKSCGEVVELTVTLLDKSKSWSKTAKAPLERSVWIFGQEMGMGMVQAADLE
jgi:hypothetical protein